MSTTIIFHTHVRNVSLLPVAARNLQSFRDHNPGPDTIIMPVHHQQCASRLNPTGDNLHLPDSTEINVNQPGIPSDGNLWGYLDRFILQWFSDHGRHFKWDRFIWAEWDCYCNTPLSQFYKDVWHQPLACAGIKLWPQDQRRWQWWNGDDESRKGKPWNWEVNQWANHPMQFHPRFVELSSYLCGVPPCAGLMFRRDVLERISELSIDPLFDGLFDEMRLGTMARYAGFQPRLIRPDIDKFISWKGRKPTGPGIWHKVTEAVCKETNLDT